MESYLENCMWLFEEGFPKDSIPKFMRYYILIALWKNWDWVNLHWCWFNWQSHPISQSEDNSDYATVYILADPFQ